jgi:hypothetical protein
MVSSLYLVLVIFSDTYFIVSVLSVKITIFCSGLLCLSKKSGNFSSFYAFKETLNRFILSSKIMLKMIKGNAIIIAPNINISQYILEDKEEELSKKSGNFSKNISIFGSMVTLSHWSLNALSIS